MNALVTDAVDVINRVDLKVIDLIQRNKTVVLEAAGTQHFTDSDVHRHGAVQR